MRPPLPLLFFCALAPAVLAQSTDLRVSLAMQQATFFYDRYTSIYAIGTLTLTNAGKFPRGLVGAAAPPRGAALRRAVSKSTGRGVV